MAPDKLRTVSVFQLKDGIAAFTGASVYLNFFLEGKPKIVKKIRSGSFQEDQDR